jgi:hypothetical protein
LGAADTGQLNRESLGYDRSCGGACVDRATARSCANRGDLWSCDSNVYGQAGTGVKNRPDLPTTEHRIAEAAKVESFTLAYWQIIYRTKVHRVPDIEAVVTAVGIVVILVTTWAHRTTDWLGSRS